MSVILETKKLQKYFKTPKGFLHAVEDVSLQIEQGETLGIVGESGCGKSTLGRTILHLLEPTGGQVFFEGKDITNVHGRELKELRRKMQIIFQDPFSSLNPRMTVGEIIGEPLRIFRVTRSREEYSRRISELMDLVGLAQRNINSYPHEFDGGRRQRIGIARALCLGPNFIVCDEPVSALDVSIQAQILNLLQELQEHAGRIWVFEGRCDPRRHRTRQAVYKDVKRVARMYQRAGSVRKGQVSPHSARKLAAVEAYRRGGLDAAQRLLNHSDPIVTLLYALSDTVAERPPAAQGPQGGPSCRGRARPRR